jgi:hypothetical protein
VNAQAAILDFENRVKMASITANEPFLFFTGVGEEYSTGMTAWSLKGFLRVLEKVTIKSLEFHNGRGDFEKWAEKSLQDDILTQQLKKMGLSKLKGEPLRKALIKAFEKRFGEIKAQAQTAIQYF